jgi:hypothetical protein
MKNEFDPFLVCGPKPRKNYDQRLREISKKIREGEKRRAEEKKYNETIRHIIEQSDYSIIEQGEVWECKGFIGYKNK